MTRALSGLILAALALSFGMRQFGGYDCSMLIETAWRQHLGQRPYTDFPCTLPPGFFLPARWAFASLGASWWSLVAFNAALIAGAVPLAAALLETSGLERRLAVLTAAATLATGMVQTAHPWHSAMASTAGALAVAGCAALLARPSSWLARSGFALAMAAVALSKPNVAAPLCVALPACLACDREARRPGLIACAAGAALAWLVLAAHGLSAGEVLRSYADAATARASLSHLEPWELPPSDHLLTRIALGISWVAVTASVWAGYRAGEVPARLAVAATGFFVAVVGLFSNIDVKQNDYPLLVLSTALALHLGRANRWLLVLFLVPHLASGLHEGAVRHRNLLVGQRIFYEEGAAVRVEDPPFFRGLITGPRLAQVLASMKRCLADHPGRRVFFGPRVDFGYAAFGRESPEGLPVWWHAGSAYASEDEPALVDAWDAHRFELLIFLQNDYFRLPEAIVRHVFRNDVYRRIEGYPELTVFSRRAP